MADMERFKTLMRKAMNEKRLRGSLIVVEGEPGIRVAVSEGGDVFITSNARTLVSGYDAAEDTDTAMLKTVLAMAMGWIVTEADAASLRDKLQGSSWGIDRDCFEKALSVTESADLTNEVEKAVGKKYSNYTNLDGWSRTVGLGEAPEGFGAFPALVCPTTSSIVIQKLEGAPPEVPLHIARAATAYCVAWSMMMRGQDATVAGILDEMEHRLGRVKAGRAARKWLEDNGLEAMPSDLKRMNTVSKKE